MHRITPEADEAIKQLAITLPPMQRLNPNKSLMTRKIVRRVQGKDLPKSYKKKNDWVPMGWYNVTFSEPVLVNHKVNLVTAFKKDGYQGLQHYKNALNNFLTQNDTYNVKAPVKLPWWRRIFKSKKPAM